MALKDHEIAELVNETTQNLRRKIRKPPAHLRQIVSVAIVDSLKKMNAREDHTVTAVLQDDNSPKITQPKPESRVLRCF